VQVAEYLGHELFVDNELVFPLIINLCREKKVWIPSNYFAILQKNAFGKISTGITKH